MIRKLLLPLAAVALLGGCVTSGYSYRQGNGDYYYGAPSVEYRYHTPYGYGYPYSYYGYGGSYGYGYRYASPYRYRQYYPYPYYYGYPYRRPNHYYYRRPAVDPSPDRTRSPWRDLNRHGRAGMGDGGDATQLPAIAPRSDGDANIDRRPRRRLAPVDGVGVMRPRAPMPTAPQPQPQPRFSPEPRRDSSALGGMVRRANRKSDPTDETTP